jgi:PhnB protein
MRRLLLQIYAKNRAEAFDFYKDAFDAEIGYCDKADDGTIVHAELNICGQSIAVGELYYDNMQTISGNTMQFCVQFEPGEEHIIERAYGKMKDGGKVLEPLSSCFFSPLMTDIIDKYGVHWCLFIG